LDNHAMRCWGRGTWGQLGYGNLDDVGDDENPGAVGPVSLGPGRRAVRIELGESQSCAILDNAKLRCWGFNEGGELGLGHIENIGDNELPSSQPTVAFGRP
jgi:alpha-tubulin suppressor-like RCC1 family protein